jgi:hypothetical protein
MGEKVNSYRMLIRKLGRKRTFERSIPPDEDSIKRQTHPLVREDIT